MMIEISIIIPCFEAEKYVIRCLDSLLGQAIDKSLFEVICVDDGSSDATYSFLCTYKERHPELNILLVRCDQNHGPSHARNIGIKKANGKYLSFLDIDDIQTPDAYEKLLEPLKNKQYEVVIGKHVRDKIDSVYLNNVSKDRRDRTYEFKPHNGHYWHKYTDVGRNGDFFTLGASLILREIVVDNNVYFPEEYKINEDDYWFSVLQLYVKDIYIVDWIIHIYVINENSLMTTANNRLLERNLLYKSLLNVFKERGVFYDMYPIMVMFFLKKYLLSGFYVFLIRMKDKPDLELFNEVLRYYIEVFPDWSDYIIMDDLLSDEKKICNLIKNKSIYVSEHIGILDDDDIRQIKTFFDNSSV